MGSDYTAEQDPGIANIGLPDSECNLAADTVVMPVKLCNLPPLNAVANHLLALSADPDVDLQQLSAVMERDPAFAADVLFLANSSLFGFPERMRVLRHAIAVLGLDRIRALAVTVAMRGFLGKGSPLVRQCWRHSVASALICEEMAPIVGVTSGVAYTVGLMHDIGLLGLVRTYPKEAEVLLTTTFDTVERVLEGERGVLGIDHGRAGAWLAKNWALPSTFPECCEHHHDPVSSADAELLKLVKVGCRMADALGYSAFRYTNSFSYDDVVRLLSPSLHGAKFPSAADLRTSIEAKLALFQ
jgi:HD-like signal output (HDOD) protein